MVKYQVFLFFGCVTISGDIFGFIRPDQTRLVQELPGKEVRKMGDDFRLRVLAEFKPGLLWLHGQSLRTSRCRCISEVFWLHFLDLRSTVVPKFILVENCVKVWEKILKNACNGDSTGLKKKKKTLQIINFTWYYLFQILLDCTKCINVPDKLATQLIKGYMNTLMLIMMLVKIRNLKTWC